MAGKVARTYSSRPSNLVIPNTVSISKKTLKTWKEAIESASDPDEPSRVELMENYDSFLLEPHLASLIESRILKILRSKPRFVNDKKEEVPDVLHLIEKPWFDEFLSNAMWSKFKGTTVIEMWDLNEDGELVTTDVIPRENCNFKKGFFAKEVGDDNGVFYKEGAYTTYYIQVGKNNDLGVLKDVGPSAIALKFTKAAWLELCEKYGIAPKYITTNSRSDTRHQELADMLKKMVSSHYAVLQGDETLETLNGIQGDPHEVFDKLRQALMSDMSKRIGGHDSVNENKDTTGTYGSLQTLKSVADDRHESDKTFIKYLINQELIPRLILMSPTYAPLKGLQFDWDDFKELTASELISAVKDLSAAGFQVDPKHVEQKTGIPIIGLKQATTESNIEDPEKKKTNLKAIRAELSEAYKGTPTDESKIIANALDNDFNDFIRSVYYDKNAVKTPFKLVLNIANQLQQAIEKEFKVQATSAGYQDAFFAHLQNNIFVFSAAKTFTEYQELSTLLLDENGKKRSWQSFKDEALKIHQKYNVDYLATEYITANRTAQMAGKWQVFGKTKHLFDLQIDTAGDDKVRPDHQKLHGLTRPYDDPIWDRLWTPFDWRCRCSIRQVAKGTRLSNEEELKNLPKSPNAFRFNAGKQQLIFSNEHPYIKNLLKNSTRELQAVKDYGLPEVEKIYARGKTISNSITEFNTIDEAKNWFDNLNQGNTKNLTAKIGKSSYKLPFTKEAFKHIVNDNKDNRWKWIKAIPNIVNDANEVYLLNYKVRRSGEIFETYRFIKYYESHILVVNVEVGNNFTIKTAYEIKSAVNERIGKLLYTK